ncbi:junctional adhesion molecule B-like [Scleropages formosus]|nr:junctional adhesion molecule B-like [Scleropages formosus]
MWCFSHNKDSLCTEPPYVCHSENKHLSSVYKDRAECFGDEEKNCTLKIKNIRHTDSGLYKFRFTTNMDSWCGQPGVNLQVAELRVVMMSSPVNGPIREGYSIKLICETDRCSLNRSKFIWFKDKQRLPETHSTLHFNPVSLNHTGNYSCALQKNKNVLAMDFSLDINANIIPSSEISVVQLMMLSVILLVLIVVGLVIIIYIKRKKDHSLTMERDRKDDVQEASRHSSNDTYVSLDVKCRLSDYDTLMGVKSAARHTNTELQTSTESPIYENTKTMMRK